MHIKGYTTEVPADRSISLIEAQLVRCGAEHISKTYAGAEGEKECVAIMFQIPIDERLKGTGYKALLGKGNQ